MSDKKINNWLDAGLIDAETALRIRDYEADQSRPLGLWALIGLGALAIGLGIISVVAANWDDIPGLIRLTVHGLLIAGTAFGIFMLQPRNGFLGLYLKDVLLFILAFLGATFFGHLGQVYQTSSPLWQPLATWLLLFSPLLLLAGRGWLISLLWVAGLLGTAIAHWSWFSQQGSEPSSIYVALITSAPIAALIFATFVRKVSSRQVFWKQVGQFAMASFVAGVTLKLIADGLTKGGLFGFEANIVTIAAIHLGLWGAAALFIYVFHRTTAGISMAAILAAAAIISFVSSLAQSTEPLVSAIVFMAFWAANGWSANYAGWRNIFQMVVAVVALRLVILSFELASDLLSSGLGLILAGVITIFIAVVAYRFSKAFAPGKTPAIDQMGGDQ